jgi:hypothetical protein
MLMQPVGRESLDNSIADENYFEAIEIPSGMVAPLDMDNSGGFFQAPDDPLGTAGKVAYGSAVAGASFVPGAGFVDAAGGAVDIYGQPLLSFGENIRQGNYLDAGFQALGVAGDVATYAAPLTLGTSALVGALLKGPGAARKITKAKDVASDVSKVIETPKSIEQTLSQKYPDIDISVFENQNGLTLSKIVVPENQRSEGIGTKVMDDLIDYADKNNLSIGVTPDATFGGSKTRLESFYKKFGFVRNKGRNKDFTFRETFVRQPLDVNVGSIAKVEPPTETNVLQFDAEKQKVQKPANQNLLPRDETSGHAADGFPAQFGPPAHNMNLKIDEEFSPSGVSTFSTNVGDDYENLKFFVSSVRGTPEYQEEVAFLKKLKEIKGNPNAEVTVYRASPTDDLRSGDLITPIKSDAEFYVEQSKITRDDIIEAQRKARLDTDEPIDLKKEKAFRTMDDIMGLFPEPEVSPSKVFTYKVKAKDIRWDGNNGLIRWGYFPDSD